MEPLIFLSKDFRLHHRINERAFMRTRYTHERIGEIVNNVLFKRKDETEKLKRV
jgi:hypothetical protein